MNALYIIYSSVDTPLIHSQVIPYIKELSKKGINFSFISFEPNNLAKNILLKEFNSHNIKWYPLPHIYYPFFPKSLLDIIYAIFYIMYLIKKNKIRVIHCRSYIPVVMCYLSKKIFNVKIIFDMRGLMVDEYVISCHWSKNSIKYRIGKFIERLLVHNSDIIIVVSNLFKEYVKNSFNINDKKIKIIYNCVDIKRFEIKNIEIREDKLKKSKFILTYCGSLKSGWYNPIAMVDFFIILKEFIPSAHFLILTQDIEIAKIVCSNKISSDTYTIIKAKPDDIPKYLYISNAGIYFATYVDKCDYFQLPVKFAEYLISCLPVIANKELKEIVAIIEKYKVGVVVDELTDIGYRKAINELFLLQKDNSLKERCKMVAKTVFSLEIGVEKYAKIYNELA